MAEGKVAGSSESPGVMSDLLSEICGSPVSVALIGIICFLLYKIVKSRRKVPAPQPAELDLPKLRKDFNVEELRKYDGTQPDGRILVAVNGKVFDVTRGKRFYGPDGPYSAFAGRDASRGLATFSVGGKDEYDDLSDLNAVEMDSIREWEIQFTEKYALVGRLLKPGEEPTNYSDDEEESAAAESQTEKKNE
ncbi:membrane-associated progesterone receptor component 1 [Ischnura elegans]|uniref:membrane-associated progesterone receptor component 1 n=1 Tax=Ischnura elegans TaxID=197161 RepID=UPI001ED8AEAF|nr:membrane-associated progesterone receptor component 1 [Ischnura elegans]